MATVTTDQLPVIEELVVLAAHQLLINLAKRPADFPASVPGDLPAVVPDVFGDALNALGSNPISTGSGTAGLSEWHEALVAGLRAIGADPNQFEAWRSEVVRIASDSIELLSRTPMREAALAIFAMVFAPVLTRSGVAKTLDGSALATAAFHAAVGRLDQGQDDWHDDAWSMEEGRQRAADVVRGVRGRLADEEWTRIGPDGFDWWAHRLRQSVRTGAPVHRAGTALSRIAVRTPVATAVSADADTVCELISELNAECGCDALVFDPAKREILASADVWAGEFDGDPSNAQLLLSVACLEGVFIAERRCDLIAAAVKGVPCDSAHPYEGPRVEPYWRLELMARPDRTPYPFPLRAEDFASIAATDPFTGQLTTFGPTGLTTEVPCLGAIPAVAAPAGGPQTALLTMSSEGEVAPRPETSARRRLGPGLLVRLVLPLAVPAATGRRVANALNLAEAGSPPGVDRLGAWYAEAESLAYCSFLTTDVCLSPRDHVSAAEIACRIAVGCATRSGWVLTRPEMAPLLVGRQHTS